MDNEFNQIPVNPRLDLFKKMTDELLATSDAAYVKYDGKSPRTRFKSYSKEEIIKIVENGDSVARAELSKYFFTVSGIYKRVILHYATFLTYSWIVVPYLKHTNTPIEMTDKAVKKAYYNATDFCTSFQIQRKCGLFAKDVLVTGAYYGILHDQGDKVVIQDLPFRYCRTRFKNQDDIDIIEFNLEFFDSIQDTGLRQQILKTYPKVVQKEYKAYKKNKDRSKWMFLPAEMGIYFSFFEEKPFFLDLIPLLVDLEDYKDIDKERNRKALKKIITSTVPIDNEGHLIFEPDEALEMHKGICQMVKNNPDIDVITSYNKTDILDLSSKDDQKTEVDNVLNLIYESAGLSKEFFFSTTEAGLRYSTYNDLSMMMILGDRFAHFFTTLLNYKFSNTKTKFKLIILPVSRYTLEEYSERAEKQASFGYSFLTPIVATGLDQTNLSNLKALENDLLELDEILKPLQSSYTQSGKASGEPIGATKGQTSEGKDKKEEQQEDTKEQEQKGKEEKKEEEDN